MNKDYNIIPQTAFQEISNEVIRKIVTENSINEEMINGDDTWSASLKNYIILTYQASPANNFRLVKPSSNDAKHCHATLTGTPLVCIGRF